MGSNIYVSYETLKEAALSINISPLSLEELKLSLKAQIASTRRHDCIRSLKELIDVLERRDELSADNLDFLYKLANHCQSFPLRDALLHYRVPNYNHESLRLENTYRDLRLAESLKENLRMPRTYGNSQVSFECAPRVPATVSCVGLLADDKRKAIYKKLCKELGKDWRNFGRELNICEGDIDNIESQSQDLSTRIYKLLKLFEEDDCNDPKKHCLLLCRALDECRRKDLRRQVEEIMSH